MRGADIRRARQALDWTQKRLAAEAGAPHEHTRIVTVENGAVERWAAVLARALRERVAASLAAGKLDTEASDALAALEGAHEEASAHAA